VATVLTGSGLVATVLTGSVLVATVLTGSGLVATVLTGSGLVATVLTGSDLVATVLFRSRHSRKVINMIHFYKLFFFFFFFCICNMFFCLRGFLLGFLVLVFFVIFQLSICNMHCSFRGFMLGYKDLEIMEATVTLQNNDPDIHLDIIADFCIFTPSVACALFGKLSVVLIL
jgi:hypothetical protein